MSSSMTSLHDCPLSTHSSPNPNACEKKTLADAKGVNEMPANISLFLPKDPVNSMALQEKPCEEAAPNSFHCQHVPVDVQNYIMPDGGSSSHHFLPQRAVRNDSPAVATPPLIAPYIAGDQSHQMGNSSTMTPLTASAAEVVTDADDELTAAECESFKGRSDPTNNLRVYRHDPYAMTPRASAQSPSRVVNRSCNEIDSKATPTSATPQAHQQANFLQMQYYQLQMGRNSGVGAPAVSADPYLNKEAKSSAKNDDWRKTGQSQDDDHHREKAVRERTHWSASPHAYFVPQCVKEEQGPRRPSIPVTQSSAEVRYEESLLNYSDLSKYLSLHDNPKSEIIRDKGDPIMGTKVKTPSPSTVSTDEIAMKTKAKVKIATISFSVDDIFHSNIDQLKKSANAVKSARLHQAVNEFTDKTQEKFSFRARAAFRVSPGDRVVVEYLVKEKDITSYDFFYYKENDSHVRRGVCGQCEGGAGTSSFSESTDAMRTPTQKAASDSNPSKDLGCEPPKELVFLARAIDDACRMKIRNVILCKHLGQVMSIDEEDETSLGEGDKSADTPINKSPMILPRILRRATSTDIRKYELLRLCDAVSVTETQRVVTKLHKDGALYHQCCQPNTYGAASLPQHTQRGFNTNHNQFDTYYGTNPLDGRLISAITNPKFLQLLLPPSTQPAHNVTTATSFNAHQQRRAGPPLGNSASPLVVRSIEWLFDKSAAIVVIALPSPFLRKATVNRNIACQPQLTTTMPAFPVDALNIPLIDSHPMTDGRNHFIPSLVTHMYDDTEECLNVVDPSTVVSTAFPNNCGPSNIHPLNEKILLSQGGLSSALPTTMSGGVAVTLNDESVATRPHVQDQRALSESSQALGFIAPVQTLENQIHYMPVYRRFLPLIHNAVSQRLQTNVLLKIVLTE